MGSRSRSPGNDRRPLPPVRKRPPLSGTRSDSHSPPSTDPFARRRGQTEQEDSRGPGSRDRSTTSPSRAFTADQHRSSSRHSPDAAFGSPREPSDLLEVPPRRSPGESAAARADERRFSGAALPDPTAVGSRHSSRSPRRSFDDIQRPTRDARDPSPRDPSPKDGSSPPGDDRRSPSRPTPIRAPVTTDPVQLSSADAQRSRGPYGAYSGYTVAAFNESERRRLNRQRPKDDTEKIVWETVATRGY